MSQGDTFSSLESLANFPEENPNPVMRVDKDSVVVVYANRAARDMLARMGGTLGAPAPDLIATRAREAVESRRGTTTTFSCPPLFFEMICAPVEGADYCNIYCRDMTTFRLMEQGVRDLAKFPDENPNPVIRITDDLKLKYFNVPFRHIAVMWGTELGDVVPGQIGKAVRQAFDSEQTRQLEISCGDRLFEFDLTPIPQMGYCNGYGKDITERRRAQESLIEAHDTALSASESKSRFLANMSHELRTPMNAVLGMNELMLRTSLDATQRQYAESIEYAAKSLLYLLNEVLDFSKIEANHMKLHMATFSITELAREFLRPLALGAQRKGLDLQCAIDPAIPSLVLGDKHRLRQILMNLTSNAIKFTDVGEITIRVRATGGDAISFEVRDTGIGIPREAREDLFSAFTQVDETGTRRHGGTGLGLTISQKLVAMMGGELNFTSQPGKGSTFYFEVSLPTVAAAPEVSTEELQHHSTLIAVDSSIRRQVLGEYLTSWSVPHASIADTALIEDRLAAAARDGAPFESVILDVADPRPTLDALRAHPERFGRPRVLLLGTLDASAQESKVADHLLTKPVCPTQLLHALSDSAGVTRQPTKPDDHSLSYENLRILVVDDSELNRFVATAMLRTLGVEPDVVEDGQQALDSLAKQSYDIVFMDCQMPALDGYETTRALRAREGEEGRTHVVALTAHVLSHDRDKAIEAGMDDYVEKPVSIASLRDALDRWRTLGKDLAR